MNKILPILGTLGVIVMTSALVACGPEKMTASQACKAYLDMDRNTPRNDQVASAEYRLPYLKDWSSRIDGTLGQAFHNMARSEEIVIAEGGAPMDDKGWNEYYPLMSSVLEVNRICDPL